jgi:DNA ligase (NAD+)
VAWFHQPRNRSFVEKLEHAGVNLERESRAQPTDGPLENRTFVITGTLSQPRREVAALIEQHGGKVTSSVSRDTDFLVAGDSPGSTKLRQAQELGTPVIDESALRDMTARQNEATRRTTPGR